ncbi:hypothetical protein PL2TA16_04912 [Pseudoalteromonas luteoviolacea 2ta16]|uniref:Solute-binding protein family 3/N-terminal domain-containing protein n=1 Tax=Pseudoalteromonas luteoviolacea (strain 2ta16) TaxID=1353533 RepID=V4H3P0_PSEL2|nr:hypothetical protein [Pseudoalteromonas luteoviolacea]ESP92076.1 hypothetical protein PL2TA16_04912 [Pseudoalteromonas luteoviolacea 2ta16]
MFKRYVLLVFLSFQVISSDKPLRVATGNYPPFTGNQLIDDGFVNHIIRLAMATQGIQVEFVYLPWKRSFQSAKLGQFEMASYWVCEPQYQQDFYCSDHVYQGTQNFILEKRHLSLNGRQFETYNHTVLAQYSVMNMSPSSIKPLFKMIWMS